MESTGVAALRRPRKWSIHDANCGRLGYISAVTRKLSSEHNFGNINACGGCVGRCRAHVQSCAASWDGNGRLNINWPYIRVCETPRLRTRACANKLQTKHHGQYNRCTTGRSLPRDREPSGRGSRSRPNWERQRCGGRKPSGPKYGNYLSPPTSRLCTPTPRSAQCAATVFFNR